MSGTLTSTFRNFLLGGGRAFWIALYMGGKIGRLGLNTICPWIFKNYNKRQVHDIPQPLTFNSWKELDIIQTLGSLLWGNDYQAVYSGTKGFESLYFQFKYAALVKGFFPTKASSMENINMNRAWENSYFN